MDFRMFSRWYGRGPVVLPLGATLSTIFISALLRLFSVSRHYPLYSSPNA